MSTNNSWFPGRCQVCGAGATTQINGAEWYCAIHVPNRPLSYPIAGRPEDLAELSALRARCDALEKERDNEQRQCFYCGELCEPLAGNPGRWPLVFPQPDGTGRVKHHHASCVTERLSRAETAEAIAAELARVARAAEDELKPCDEDGPGGHTCGPREERLRAALAALSPAARAKIGGTP